MSITKNAIILIMLSIICKTSFSQNWPKIYGDNIHAYGLKILESYDKGFVICGDILKDPSTFKYGWIIKTDINGNILWNKKFGDSYREDYFLDMDYTADNGWIISGVTSQLDIMNDPVYVKLNACGEIEWCKIFTSPGYNTANGVVSLPNGEFIGMLQYYNSDGIVNRIGLVKMDASGEPLWIKYLAQQDTAAHNEDGFYLYQLPDTNYLVTGRTFNPSLKPYLIMTDTTGNEIWNINWPNGNAGYAGQSAFTSNNMIYNASQLRFPEQPKIPYLLKCSRQGEVINQYPLLGDTIVNGGAETIYLLNDSTLYSGITWTDDPLLQYGYSDILKTDTLGNLKLQRRLLNSMYPPTSIAETSDSNLLVLGYYPTGSNWDIYLWKMNQDLQDDTLSTQALTYDSLCPYPIVNDTLALNCSLFVDVKEIPTQEQYESTIRISPNPAKDWIVLNLPEGSYPKPVELSIYNLFGQEVINQVTQAQDRNITLNIAGLSQGLYIAVVKGPGNKLMKGKFIVEH